MPFPFKKSSLKCEIEIIGRIINISSAIERIFIFHYKIFFNIIIFSILMQIDSRCILNGSFPYKGKF